MADQDEAELGVIAPDLRAILDAQKNAILGAVNLQIQGLQKNLLQAQTELASEIASEIQPDTYVFKRKGNEQQYNFNRKIARTNNAAVKALETGNVAKAKVELGQGISLLNNRQKLIKLADKSEFGWATIQEYVCDDLADNEADASKIIGYAGFFRFSELCSIRACDIEFFPSHISIFLESSKTDQFRDGSWIAIARSCLETCPVKALEQYRTAAAINLNEDLPLFRALSPEETR